MVQASAVEPRDLDPEFVESSAPEDGMHSVRRSPAHAAPHSMMKSVNGRFALVHAAHDQDDYEEDSAYNQGMHNPAHLQQEAAEMEEEEEGEDGEASHEQHPVHPEGQEGQEGGCDEAEAQPPNQANLTYQDHVMGPFSRMMNAALYGGDGEEGLCAFVQQEGAAYAQTVAELQAAAAEASALAAQEKAALNAEMARLKGLTKEFLSNIHGVLGDDEPMM